MKKTLIIFLSLVLMLTFAACGEKNGGKSPSESSAPAETGNAPSSKAGADENRYYGIGEAAEANGLSITIDGAGLSIIQVCFQGRRTDLNM